jgi:hypothetical protein
MGCRRAGLKPVILAVASWTCIPVSAFAQGVGAIGGTVTDASDAVLPGVSVTLSNPAGAIGGNQDVVTDTRGAYEFLRLVPGRYTVKAALAGFRTAVQENIIVNADATARVDLKLDVGQIEEGVLVKGEAPLVDTTSALDQTVLSRQLLDSLPNRNDIWSVGRSVPAVTYSVYDVGGSQAIQQSSSTIHGSVAADNVYMVDGMDVSYVGPTLGITMLYFNPYMFEQVNYQTANATAERALGGIAYNLVSKTGTNAFHGMYMFTGTSPSLESNNVDATVRAQILATVSPKVLAANPNLEPGQTILSLWNTAGTLGGPIVVDKLWFVTSLNFGRLNQYRLGNYDLNGQQALDDNRQIDVAAKLSWQVNRSSQLSYLYYLNNKGQFHRVAVPAGSYYNSQATYLDNKFPSVHQVKWTNVLSSKLLLDASASLMHGVDRFLPSGGVGPGALPEVDDVLRTYTGALSYYYLNPMYKAYVTSNLTYDTGAHAFKAGYQFTRSYYGNTSVYGTSNYPSGLVAIFHNGVPEAVTEYNTPTEYKQYYQQEALYAQDRWTPLRKLTFDLGLRFETIYAWQPATCQVQTIFVQGQCFPAINGAPDFKNLAPRISVIYDLFGNGRTALKASFNRYESNVSISLLGRVNPIQVTSATAPWTDSNGDGIPELNELGQSTGFNFGTTNHYSPTLQRPYQNEYSVEIDQQLPGQILLTAAYFHRSSRNNIGSQNLAVPASSYIPLNVTVSGQPVTVYNQNPATLGKFDTLWNNFSELDTDYDGIDVTLAKRLSSHWMLISGASFGRNVGDIYTTADLNNPNYTFRRGIVGDEMPVQLRASGLYEFPYGISVSASAQHFTGLPQTTTVLVTGSTARLTQVSQSIVIDPRGTVRYSNINLTDISVRKTLRFRGLSVEPTFDVFNLFNRATVTSAITQLGQTYQQATALLTARMVKLGAIVHF